MDSFRNDGVLPDKLIVSVEDCRIGLTHGWGAADGLAEKVIEMFEGDRLDAIVFGHTHFPMNEVRNGVLIFNPGTATDKRFVPSQSIGILTVDADSISGKIIDI